MEKRWPVYYADTVKIGNKDSDKGIVCLWTKKERIIEKTDNNYCFIGQLYSKDYGLQILIRNLLANNQIRYLIVTGIDLNNSAEGLINFFEHGVEKNNKIKNTDIYLDDKIKPKHISLLKKRINLKDLRDTNINDLNDELKKLKPKKALGENIIIPLPKISKPQRFPTDFSGFKIRGTDFFRAYRHLLKNILRFGVYDKKRKRVYIANVNFFIQKLSKQDVAYLTQRQRKKWEKGQVTSFEYENEEYHTYQVKKMGCGEELKDAILTLFNDSKKNINIQIAIAHLGEEYLEDAVEIVGNNIQKKWLPDPNGNLVIRNEHGKIKVIHMDQKGKALDEIQGESAKEVYKKIASNIAISMLYHALDIGAELQKAEIALKEGKKYVQDKPLN